MTLALFCCVFFAANNSATVSGRHSSCSFANFSRFRSWLIEDGETKLKGDGETTE